MSLYYKKIKKLYESTRTDIWRAQHIKENKSVILKILKQDDPTSEDLIPFRNEYDILCQFRNIDGVIQAYNLEKHNNYWQICLEDINGISLKKILKDNHELNIKDQLTIAIKIAESLAQIHQKNIIHKDISPANIIWNSNALTLKIIDFGISTQLSKQHLLLKSPDVLEGSLPYISPEQTGRMNCPLDYRTDFYSFGASLYEFFSGKLPFESDDPVELVHSHIARQPIPPHIINPNIPSIISDIIIKLMEKTPEQRYQNALGVKADLEQCLEQLKNTSKITPFTLACFDISERFNIPQKLYGREDEVKTLLSVFERISYKADKDQLFGQTEVVMVSGFSGIGKTALIKEISKSLLAKNGYFITGKFDQLNRNIPYSALINALTELVQQLLTETEDQLFIWKKKLLDALSPNAQIIIDVIPEIELIIGPQPQVPLLGPSEFQNRFIIVFNKFLNTFCKPQHPLVIFLDDLQWVDNSSLKLLEYVISEEQTNALMLICAYRDNEVSTAHPLSITLEKLHKRHINIHQINLPPIKFKHVNQLIAESLHDTIENVAQLTELVVQKTQGNPFFVNQFLQTLYEEKLINYISQTDKHKGKWKWDIDQIKQLDITDNVATLMINRLKKLPKPIQYILSLAACIGNRFSLDILPVIYEKSKIETFQNLKPILKEGYILPKSKFEIIGDDIQNSQLLIYQFQFLHDRVQQAAYELLNQVILMLLVVCFTVLLFKTMKQGIN